MMMSCMSYCCFIRRALARNSKIVSAGVSSMYNLAFTRLWIFEFNCCHSWLSRSPFFSFSAGSSLSLERSLVTSCTEVISSEKIAIARLYPTAALRAMESTKAVLPIPGRAASTIRSAFCQPPVRSSSFEKPLGTPLKVPFSLPAFTILSRASFTNEGMSE